MRDIRFRGKRLDNGEWAQGYLNAYTDGTHEIIMNSSRKQTAMFGGNPFYTIHSERPEVDPATVGQYTGLKDSNDREIYEGDIIKIEDWDNEIFFVEYFGERDYPAFDLTPDVVDDCNGLSHIMAMGVHCEVIGNVHDSPELMQEAAHE